MAGPFGFIGKILGGTKIPVIDQVGDIIDGLHHSGEEKAQMKLAVMKLQEAGILAQLDVQKIMLSHRSVFVAGGRPALIWMCVIGIGIHVVVRPIATWATGMIDPAIPPFPEIEIDSLITLVGLALGLGVMRSMDKKEKVTDQ